MPPCADPNCCERATLGEPSPGTIDDSERLLRGAYEPVHYKGTQIKSSFAKYRDIFEGMLSVWRYDQGIGGVAATGRELVESHGPQGKLTLKDCVILDVAWLRTQVSLNGERIFCVFDDTIIDPAYNRHPDHAGIGLCNLLDKTDFAPESDNALHVMSLISAYANSQRELGAVI